MLLLLKRTSHSLEEAFMKVNKKLIEKYHDGNCTPQEVAIVESWLLSEDFETGEIPSDTIDKESIKIEMWEDITSVLPSQNKTIRLSPVYWAAASALIVLSAFVFIRFNQNLPLQAAIQSSVNSSESLNREISSEDFHISLGPLSNVRINSATGLVNFCGTLMISPKKDMNLSFNDSCTDKTGRKEKKKFKKGETYVALNYRNNNTNEVIVMEERLLMELPPVVKRQIMDQFNI